VKRPKKPLPDKEFHSRIGDAVAMRHHTSNRHGSCNMNERRQHCHIGNDVVKVGAARGKAA
jgi:hypothetical protein